MFDNVFVFLSAITDAEKNPIFSQAIFVRN